MNTEEQAVAHDRLVVLAGQAAPLLGYNQTGISCVRILRTEAVLDDIPVLYKPGTVFVLQGRKQGILEGDVYLYDEDHYLAVSVPVPFRMTSKASPQRPLLAAYLEFDMQMAAEIALQVEELAGPSDARPRGLLSSRMDRDIEDALLRLLTVLGNPVDIAVLGSSILRELHYRIMSGPQGDTVIAALQRKGTSGKTGRERDVAAGELRCRNCRRGSGQKGGHERAFLSRSFQEPDRLKSDAICKGDAAP
jgi:AraC-type transcriptional regulator N-terminus